MCARGWSNGKANGKGKGKGKGIKTKQAGVVVAAAAAVDGMGSMAVQCSSMVTYMHGFVLVFIGVIPKRRRSRFESYAYYKHIQLGRCEYN